MSSSSEIICLPIPRKDLSFPLMQALQLRRSHRRWKPEDLPLQILSDLLWAACGITSEESKGHRSRRTVPSARNSQSIMIYVALERGLFKYDGRQNILFRTGKRDIREYIGNQKMMKQAPVGLIFVADYQRLKGYAGKDDNRKWFVAGTETGFISQNVYLYCAAAQLNTVVIGLVDRERLHAEMQLPDNEVVVYTQAVGLTPDR